MKREVILDIVCAFYIHIVVNNFSGPIIKHLWSPFLKVAFVSLQKVCHMRLSVAIRHWKPCFDMVDETYNASTCFSNHSYALQNIYLVLERTKFPTSFHANRSVANSWKSLHEYKVYRLNIKWPLKVFGRRKCFTKLHLQTNAVWSFLKTNFILNSICTSVQN